MSDAEAKFQTRCRDCAYDTGWDGFKVETNSRRGYPDWLFFRLEAGRNRTVWWEFKKADEEPTEQQLLRHDELRAAGYEVYWTDDYGEFCQVMMKAPAK